MNKKYFVGILAIIVSVWIWAAKDLNEQFSELEMEKQRERKRLIRQESINRKSPVNMETVVTPSKDG